MNLLICNIIHVHASIISR